MTRLVLCFLGPLLLAAMVGLLATVLGLGGTAVSIAIYLAELVGALVLIRAWVPGAAGLTAIGTIAALALAVGLGLARGLSWLVVIPVERIDVGAAALVGLGYATVVAVAEEVHFRGLVLGALSSRFGTGRALMLSAALFAVPHAFLNGVLWIPLFVADGLLFGALRLRTGSVVPPIVAHLLGNFLTGAVLVAPRIVDDRIAVTYLVLALAVDASAVLLLLRPPRLAQRVPA